MYSKLIKYCVDQIGCIPIWVYVTALAFYVISAALLLFKYGIVKGGKYALLLLILYYYLLLLCSTVIFRYTLGNSVWHFEPFWSFYNKSGKFELLPEHIMNVVIFIPIGFMCRLLINRNKTIYALLGGIIISCTIESLQFVFRRGTCEIDDLMNNTLGNIIGVLLAIILLNFYCRNNHRFYSGFYFF